MLKTSELMRIASRVVWTFIIFIMLMTAMPFIASSTVTTVYANDARLPVAFFADRQIDTYDRPGGQVNGFLNAQTTGKQVIAWGFWHSNREYWRVSFDRFARYGGGRVTRYIRRYDLIRSNINPMDIMLPRDTRTFQRSCLSQHAGTVFGGQSARDRGPLYTVTMAGRDGRVLLLYRLDRGGSRLSWVHERYLDGATRRNDGAILCLRTGAWRTDPVPSPTGNIRLTNAGNRSGRGTRVYSNNIFVGSVTQGFDDRQTNGRYNNPPLRGHLGIDIDALGTGARVPALLAGRVVATQRHANSNGGLGANQYTVILEHNVGGVMFFSAYYHLRSNGRPTIGTWINAGDRIGYEWNNHVHVKFFQGSHSPAMWGYFGGANRRDFPTMSNDFIDFDGRRFFHPVRVIQTNGQHVVNHRR